MTEPKGNLPPLLLDTEGGDIRVYFVTDLPILNEVKYRDKQNSDDLYNMANLEKAKVVHIGIAGRRIVKVTKDRIYHGDASIVANLMQLAKSAARRKNHDYPLLKLVYQLAQGDLSVASRKLKLHIHESARFTSRLEAIDYVEVLKFNFLPSLRHRSRYKFLEELAASNIYGDQTTPADPAEAHAEKLIKEIDDEIF